MDQAGLALADADRKERDNLDGRQHQEIEREPETGWTAAQSEDEDDAKDNSDEDSIEIESGDEGVNNPDEDPTEVESGDDQDNEISDPMAKYLAAKKNEKKQAAHFKDVEAKQV